MKWIDGHTRETARGERRRVRRKKEIKKMGNRERVLQ